MVTNSTAPDVAKKVREYFSQYPLLTYPKGQILVFTDENPTHIFYLIKGRVRKYDISYRGDEVVVNVFKPGAFFPMSWAINHDDNKFFYKTEDKTELHIVPADAALKFLADNPDVMLDLLSRLYRGMEGILGRLVHLMSGTAKSRLIYELIIECRRFSSKTKDGYVLQANEIELAARTGLSRETVNREIQKLKAARMVNVDGSKISINDLPALEKLLGSQI